MHSRIRSARDSLREQFSRVRSLDVPASGLRFIWAVSLGVSTLLRLSAFGFRLGGSDALSLRDSQRPAFRLHRCPEPSMEYKRPFLTDVGNGLFACAALHWLRAEINATRDRDRADARWGPQRPDMPDKCPLTRCRRRLADTHSPRPATSSSGVTVFAAAIRSRGHIVGKQSARHAGNALDRGRR